MSDNTSIFPQRSQLPTIDQIHTNLRKAIDVANQAKQFGKHPFGCILVGPDNQEVLFRQGNINTLNHAESTLCRIAFDMYPPEFLWKCTLYTNFEPCCMCAGSIYWGNIGRVVYGLTESRLLELTGNDKENMTLDLTCTTVFSKGQKDIQVLGPFEELANEVLKDHLEFWNGD
ncbi:hypothetical protein CANARDRAFT_176641 [[Candida] arabinofermentans NRRL YB-2248]|uniref:CMP/dCMP-type deaminase domain-containing protein n=1 Tax=[Candida] arabinofermentans NRRL YB-2248 TaxID=983967 RepID=A0A1E4SZ78_9ASCO|nr:hypothetical protein CANARDRAFT_176641 [[Candida] arabinofermentans NRRL YB-2248]